METLFEEYDHITPSEDELKPMQKIECSQPDCTSIFNNLGNLEMHMEKHHKIPLKRRDNRLRLYYCPVANCIYRVDRGEEGKFFKNLKYLKQHYQKVHMIRGFKCHQCNKSFITETKLQLHVQKQLCDKKFICHECKWSYDSMEALQTHGNRKAHQIRDPESENHRNYAYKMPSTKPLKSKSKAMERIDQKTQDKVETCTISVQTDFHINDINHSNTLSDIQLFLKDIETQTDPFLYNHSSCGNINSSMTSATNYLDQMLGQSSHMYTQTCDDLLSELGLTDIQTQTNWPSSSSSSGRELNCVQLTSTATSTNTFVHDELLVSTETQTSFTQCLLNSCTDVATINANTNSNGNDNNTGNVTVVGEPFSCLYNTQCTQTCDSILDEFNFDAQANDFIDGFHSTYTQT